MFPVGVFALLGNLKELTSHVVISYYYVVFRLLVYIKKEALLLSLVVSGFKRVLSLKY